MTICREKLLQLRKERGWSQEKLATISGISERTIQRIERDGTCSLESQLALASTFDISPTELAPTFKPTEITYSINWGGVFGLLLLGLAISATAIVTMENQQWEVISCLSVTFIPIVISCMTHGISPTIKFVDSSSWLVKTPSYAPQLNQYIQHSKAFIANTYIVGALMGGIAAITLFIHAPDVAADTPSFIAIIVKPMIYSILFNELYNRLHKRRLEIMLAKQLDDEANSTPKS